MNPNSEIRFGKYSVVQKIGAGGMAEVFKCRLSGIGGFDKVLVVKRIKPELLGEPEFIRMFLDEARVAAYLNHPNIVQVFEVDQFEGIPYIAMEYVRGPTLWALLRRAKAAQRLDIGHAAQILSGVCEGLYHAHCACDGDGQVLNIVHRDVSPHNVIVSYEGIPKVLDFGVARARGRQTATDAGTLKGKLRYMAPEQLRGGVVDERADVFGVGVCLFEAATGEAPYLSKTDAEVIHDVFKGLSALPDRFPDGFPEQLEQIIRWAAEPEVGRRCPTCFDLHAALEDFLAAGPHASSQKGVAAWLAELFVGPSGDSMPGLYGLTPASKLGSRSQGSLSRRTAASGAPGAAPRPGAASAPAPLASGLVASAGPNDSVGGPDPRGPTGPAPASPDPSAETLIAPPSPAPIGSEAIAPMPAAPSAAAPDLGLEDAARALTALPAARRKRALAGLGIAVAAAAALALFSRGRGEPSRPPEAPSAAAAPAAASAAPGDNAAARAYLEEAERLAAAHRFAPALDLLAKAKDLKISDPALNIRLSKMSDGLERDALLARAQKLLADGDQRGAVELAKRVLDRDLENAAAARIIASAREAREAEAKARAAATATRPKPEPKAIRDGKLSVTSEPAGIVYLDDEPIGRSPIRFRAVREGQHSVQVRLEGYLPIERAVEIAPGKESALALNLTPVPHPHLASAELPDVGERAPAPAPTKVEPSQPARVELEPAAVVESAAPAAAPLRPAPVVRRPTRLPARYSAGSTKDLVHALQVIENQAIADGAPAEVARDVTFPLGQELAKRIGPSEPVEVYPRAIYSFIVEASTKGAARGELAAQLRSAQLSGQLAANADR
jgi:serine/threonine protein kinase